MLNRRYRLLAPLSIFASSALVLANIVHVPGDLPTIQEALDSISTGDTVLVGMGTYPEALTAPLFPFWIMGDVPVDTGDFPRPIIDASLLPDSTHRPDLTLPHGSLPMVERMSLRKSQDLSQGAAVESACDSAAFNNCVFDSCHGGFTWIPQDSTPRFLLLERCEFRGPGASVEMPGAEVHANACVFLHNDGWALWCGSRSLIENCQFTEIANICVVSSYGTNVTIKDCIFGPSDPLMPVEFLYLININVTVRDNLFIHLRTNSRFIELQPDSRLGATISGNMFYDCNYRNGLGGSLLYVYTEGQNDAVPYLIENNVMLACTTGNLARAVYASRSGTIRHNRFHHVRPPLQSDVPVVFADTVTSIVLRANLFYENGLALAQGMGNPVDAIWNWWGDSSGPYHATDNPAGLGDTIIGAVDFTPWYTDTLFLSVLGLGKPLPEKFVLDAYPNPFNSTVTLKLVPTKATIVKLELFDVLGRKVKEIWSGPLAFERRIVFDAGNLASGVYFARAWEPTANRPLALTKLLLLR